MKSKIKKKIFILKKFQKNKTKKISNWMSRVLNLLLKLTGAKPSSQHEHWREKTSFIFFAESDLGLDGRYLLRNAVKFFGENWNMPILYFSGSKPWSRDTFVCRECLPVCHQIISNLIYLAFIHTVKLGYNELYGTVNICSL